ncbi:MAG TPA: TonB-dependent receptor [Novosphingobium sp.]|nr:TonB-dependent receptor [Novosphingobium sp.]
MKLLCAGASLLALSISGTALSGTALAQEANETPQPAPTTDEIVVTAQFRAQNLQDTPLAITAVSGELLAARGQTNVSEIAAQAPNVTLKPQGQELGPGIIAFIRGVGQTDPNFALEPGVGMYIDDVYLPTLTGSLLDLTDLDRVEVLRGPQGTLAGRNSLGGSIKLYSKKPTGSNTGSIEVTYGRYNRLDARGLFDVKLSDNLFMRVAGVTKNVDGYVKRLDYNLTHPGTNVPTFARGADPELGTLGGQSYAAGKVSLRWQPTETVDINLSGDYTRERNEPGANVLYFANTSAAFDGPNATFTGGRPFLQGTNGAGIPLNCAFVPNGVNSCDTLSGYDRRYVSYATYGDPARPDSQMPFKPTFNDPHSDLDNYGAALTIDVDLSDELKLKSISSWRKYTADWSYDSDGSPIANNNLNQTQKNRQWSQELRLSGKVMDDRLDFTVGGFYFDTRGTFTGRINLNYAGIDFLHGPDPTPAKNKALFGNFTFALAEGANLTGGIRKSWDEKDYGYARRNPDGSAIQGPCNFFLGAPTAGPTGLGNQPNCLLFGLNGLTASFRDSRVDWRVAADFRFSPDFMAYAQVSTGYRAGGVNPRPFFPSQATAFTPETITAYEVGFKSDLFDRKLRVNVSAFFNDYKNIILSSVNCLDLVRAGPGGSSQATPCLRPSNVGSAHVKGFEVETLIRPVENFTIDGSVSYLDFQYQNVDTASTGVTLNDVTPYTPKWKAAVGFQYDIPDVLKGDVVLRVDGAYQSKIYTEAANIDSLAVSSTVAAGQFGFNNPGGGGSIATLRLSNRIDGYILANARIGWTSADKDWGLTFEVQNLTNKYYFTTLLQEAFGSGTASGAPGRPRTWSVTARRSF